MMPTGMGELRRPERPPRIGPAVLIALALACLIAWWLA